MINTIDRLFLSICFLEVLNVIDSVLEVSFDPCKRHYLTSREKSVVTYFYRTHHQSLIIKLEAFDILIYILNKKKSNDGPPTIVKLEVSTFF